MCGDHTGVMLQQAWHLFKYVRNYAQICERKKPMPFNWLSVYTVATTTKVNIVISIISAF